MTDEQVIEEKPKPKPKVQSKPKEVSAARIDKALQQTVYVNRTRTVEEVFRRSGLGRDQTEDIVKAILKS